MSDQQITCSDCGDVFVFTAAEQSFYEEKGLAVPPKRCKACRQARKASRLDARGRAGQGSMGGRRYSGDVNEYRSPMSGGMDDWTTPRRSYGNGVGLRGGGRREGGWGEYRSPAFPEMRDDWRMRPGGRAAHHGGRSNGHAGHASGARPPHAGRPQAEGGRQRPEANGASRPRFDITCGECGAQAQVPFKPLEGRQVFCQDCYRARRASAREGIDRMDVRETDAGIVE